MKLVAGRDKFATWHDKRVEIGPEVCGAVLGCGRKLWNGGYEKASSNGWPAVLSGTLEQMNSESKRIDLGITMALVDLHTKFCADTLDAMKT